MDQKKSNVISFQSRKAPVSEAKTEALGNSDKEKKRVSHVDETINRRGAGNFSMVPHCIYEMGLSKVEREVWCYLHRLPAWEHPVVSDMPRILEIGKTQLMDALTRLESLNMITVEGKGKARVFHLPSPAYWKHPLPRKTYAFQNGEDAPVNIGEGVYVGKLVNRPSQDETKKRKRPEQDEKKSENRPGKNVNRPSQDEKSSQPGRKNVLYRTKPNQQSEAQQGVEGPLNTIQNLTINTKSPGSPSEVGGGVEEMERSKRNETPETVPGGTKLKLNYTEIQGAMAGLYSRYTKSEVITSVVRAMIRTNRPAEDIMRLIDLEREKQQNGPYVWEPFHHYAWLEKLKAMDVSEPG